MHNDNRQRYEIAQAIGLSVSSLAWLMRKGDFGKLHSRQGRNTGKKVIDDEKKGVCFGRSDWKQTRDNIKKDWSSDEKARRSRSIMPNRERPKGLEWLHRKP
jgi:hypothetical protein